VYSTARRITGGAAVLTLALFGRGPWVDSAAAQARPMSLAITHVTVIDVVTGALMTGVIGLFVVLACAATLHRQGIRIHDASDAAGALRPLAGSLAAGGGGKGRARLAP